MNDAGAVKAHRVSTQGLSGRCYSLDRVRDRGGAMDDQHLYALRYGTVWGWIGGAQDLITDPESRRRFRDLVRADADLYRVETQCLPDARLAVIWDLWGQPAWSWRAVA